MATFRYKAKSPTGDIVSGNMDADNRETFLELLKARGFYIMEAAEKKDYNITLSRKPGVSAKELALFCRQFNTMLTSGITVSEALQLLKKQAGNPTLAETLQNLSEEIQKGRLLSEAMINHPRVFSRMMVGLVEMGESSGTLDRVFERLAIYYEKENYIAAKIRTAMVYPAVIFGVAILVVTFMMVFIVPNFLELFAGFNTELPLPTRIIIGIVEFFKQPLKVGVLIFGVALIVLGMIRLINTETGRQARDRMILRIPIFGPYNFKILANRLTRSLGELLSAGVPLLKALETCGKVMNNTVIDAIMIKVKESVSLGINLSDAIESTAMFPVMVTQMIRVGEKAGTLDVMMMKVADYYDEELETATARMVALVEPLMLVVISLIVGFIVFSIMAPIFSVYQTYM